MATPSVRHTIAKAVDKLADVVAYGLSLRHANRFSCQLSSQVDPIFTIESQGQRYRFSCPNALTRLRAQTFFTKEPETIEWIDSFEPGDVLFDIGANIGLYSIYAAKKGHRVIAFEPEAQNFALVNKNFYLNSIDEKAICLPIAFSDSTQLGLLYIPNLTVGAALNNFGGAFGFYNESFDPEFKQGGIAYSLDDFVSQFADTFPNHIKIDVDGIEQKIIMGAQKTLSDSRLKSVSVEFNEERPETDIIIKAIEQCGLTFKHKKHGPMYETGQYTAVFNYVFERAVDSA